LRSRGEPGRAGRASWLAPRSSIRSRAKPRLAARVGRLSRLREETLLSTLLSGRRAPRRGRPGSGRSIRAALGILPTPLKLQADPRVTGRGVTLALVDSGFHPHPISPAEEQDLAWADASVDPVPLPVLQSPPGRRAGPVRATRMDRSAWFDDERGGGGQRQAQSRALSRTGERGNLILVQVRRPDGRSATPRSPAPLLAQQEGRVSVCVS